MVYFVENQFYNEKRYPRLGVTFVVFDPSVLYWNVSSDFFVFLFQSIALFTRVTRYSSRIFSRLPQTLKFAVCWAKCHWGLFQGNPASVFRRVPKLPHTGVSEKVRLCCFWRQRRERFWFCAEPNMKSYALKPKGLLFCPSFFLWSKVFFVFFQCSLSCTKRPKKNCYF